MITEEEKREATYNYLKANHEYSKDRYRKLKKRIWIVAIIIMGIVVFIRFLGGIYIPYYAGYQRYYDVRLNDIGVSARMYTVNTPIVKNTLYLNPIGLAHSIYWFGEVLDGEEKMSADRYMLSVQSYSCYLSSAIAGCTESARSDKLTKLPNDDTKYRLKIYGRKDADFCDNKINDESYDLIYDGNFVGDITEYVSKEGQYIVEIEARYGLQIQRIAASLCSDGDGNVVLN